MCNVPWIRVWLPRLCPAQYLRIVLALMHRAPPIAEVRLSLQRRICRAHDALAQIIEAVCEVLVDLWRWIARVGLHDEGKTVELVENRDHVHVLLPADFPRIPVVGLASAVVLVVIDGYETAPFYRIRQRLYDFSPREVTLLAYLLIKGPSWPTARIVVYCW